LAPAAGLEPAT